MAATRADAQAALLVQLQTDLKNGTQVTTNRSSRRPPSACRRTGKRCVPSTTYSPSTGYSCARETPSSRRSRAYGCEPPRPADASHARASSRWHSSLQKVPGAAGATSRDPNRLRVVLTGGRVPGWSRRTQERPSGDRRLIMSAYTTCYFSRIEPYGHVNDVFTKLPQVRTLEDYEQWML